jgi:hypothetical protein
MANPDMTRFRAVLRDAVRLSSWTNRDIERKFGWSAGYLSRLFGGRIDLRIEHVLIICNTIGLRPGDLFRIACPPSDGVKSSFGNIVLALSRLHPQKKAEPEPPPAPEPAAPPAPSDQDLENAVLRALRKILTERTG